MYAILKDFVKAVIEVKEFLKRRKLEAPKDALRQRFRRCFTALEISSLQIARVLGVDPPLDTILDSAVLKQQSASRGRTAEERDPRNPPHPPSFLKRHGGGFV